MSDLGETVLDLQGMFGGKSRLTLVLSGAPPTAAQWDSMVGALQALRDVCAVDDLVEVPKPQTLGEEIAAGAAAEREDRSQQRSIRQHRIELIRSCLTEGVQVSTAVILKAVLRRYPEVSETSIRNAVMDILRREGQFVSEGRGVWRLTETSVRLRPLSEVAEEIGRAVGTTRGAHRAEALKAYRAAAPTMTPNGVAE